MPVIKCESCGKETNSVFYDWSAKVCYLTISEEADGTYWRRGCVPAEKEKQNPYYVWSAKQDINKKIKTLSQEEIDSMIKEIK